jgi:hypothetical protein
MTMVTAVAAATVGKEFTRPPAFARHRDDFRGRRRSDQASHHAGRPTCSLIPRAESLT